MGPLTSTYDLSDVRWVLLDTRPWVIFKTPSELLWREDWPSLSFFLQAHSARAMNRVTSIVWLLSIYNHFIFQPETSALSVSLRTFLNFLVLHFQFTLQTSGTFISFSSVKKDVHLHPGEDVFIFKDYFQLSMASLYLTEKRLPRNHSHHTRQLLPNKVS